MNHKQEIDALLQAAEDAHTFTATFQQWLLLE
jgi:hypothetical protein